MTRMTRDTVGKNMMLLRRTLIGCFLLALLLPAAANAAEKASPFDEGNARISLFLGSGYAFDKTYSIFGLGAGYFVADGLELGLDAETWSGTPGITQVSPSVRFVIKTTGPINPYAGIFYRRTFIDGYRDQDTIGARAGVFFLTGGNFYFGAGAAQEFHLTCDRAVYKNCEELYPELLVAVMF